MITAENSDLIDRVILVATEPDPDRSIRPTHQKPRVGKGASSEERTKAWLQSFSFKGWENEDNVSFTAAVKYYSNNESISETQRLQKNFVLQNRHFGILAVNMSLNLCKISMFYMLAFFLHYIN